MVKRVAIKEARRMRKDVKNPNGDIKRIGRL
jgi:hypothetical protein